MSGRIHPVWPSVATGSALILAYTGERLAAGLPVVRVVIAAAVIALLAAAIGARAHRFWIAPPDRRRVARLLLVFTAGVGLSFLVYAGSILVAQQDAPDRRLTAALVASWPVLLAISALPLAAIELAVRPVAFIDRYELSRVLRAKNRGLSLGLLLGLLFFVNLLAVRHPVRLDALSLPEVRPSPITVELVQSLEKPAEAVLFYPEDSEVLPVLKRYFEALAHEKLRFEVVDQAIAYDRARQLDASTNGVLVLAQDGRTHRLRIGEDREAARSPLEALDLNVAKGLLAVTQEERAAYFTVGHRERRIDPTSTDPRPHLHLFKRELQGNRYDVRELGLAQGLASKIPEDAALVLVIGPETAFAAEESRALNEAIARGVPVLIALEVEGGGETLEAILAPLGLRFHAQVLGHDQAYVKVTQTDADRHFIYTDRVSAHASVTRLGRSGKELLLPRAGWLERLEPPPQGVRVDLVVQSVEDTFADHNGNFRLDSGEKSGVFSLAAAVTTSTGGRVFVIADSDLFGDRYIRHQGNPLLVGDIVGWLARSRQPVLPAVTSGPERLVHRRSEDALWYYGSTFAVPLLFAGFGVLAIRRKKRR